VYAGIGFKVNSAIIISEMDGSQEYSNREDTKYNLSPTTSRVLEFSKSEATKLGRSRVNEHLFILGMIGDPESGNALSQLGFNTDQLRQILTDNLNGPVPISDKGFDIDKDFTYQLSDAFLIASHEAGNQPITPMHVLLGIVKKSIFFREELQKLRQNPGPEPLRPLEEELSYNLLHQKLKLDELIKTAN
jgi:ATP-dependent Clp protease ATP-binding subunit ClpA